MAIKWDFNIGTIAAIGIPVMTAIIYVNSELTTLREKVTQSESFRAARTAQTDKNFVDVLSLVRAQQDTITKTTVDTSNLTYRMGQIEASAQKNNENLTARMDRLSENLLGSVKTLSDRVADLSTEQRLTNQKLDNLDVPRTKMGRP